MTNVVQFPKRESVINQIKYLYKLYYLEDDNSWWTSMQDAKTKEWGEHNPCLSHVELRVPFEEYMRYGYSKPNLDWKEACSFYQDSETELRYIGFCEGAFFMCHHKDKAK